MGDDGFGGREISLDDGFDGPAGDLADLELDTSGTYGGGGDQSALMHGAGTTRMIGDGLDGFGGNEPELELDLGPMSAPTDMANPMADARSSGMRRRPVTGSLPPNRMSGPPVAASVPPVRTSGAPGRLSDPPTRSSGAHSLAPEPEVERPVPPAAVALADFGDKPANILGALPYAVHVLLRRNALNKAHGELKRLRAGTEKDYASALIELGRDLHRRREDSRLDALTKELKSADIAGDVAGQQTDEWQKVRESAQQQKHEADGKIAALEEQAAPVRAREAELAAVANEKQTALDRASAKLKRVQIELRNLDQLEAPPAGRREALVADRGVHAAEVERAQHEADVANAPLAEVREELAKLTRQITGFQKQKSAIDRSRGRAEAALSTTAKAAEDDYHGAVTMLADQALRRDLDEVSPSLAKAARNRAQELQTRDQEIELHEIALTLYHKPSLQQGLAVIGVLVLLGLVTLGFLFFG